MKSVKVIVLCILLACISHVHADVKLPKVIDSHMVLQQDAPIPVWGTAAPGETVSVSIGDNKAGARANAKGVWRALLKPMKANSTGQKMIVKGSNTLELEDILVGEVWVGSGQSNMEWGLKATHRGGEFISKADHPHIRLFHVPKKQEKAPPHSVPPAA